MPYTQEIIGIYKIVNSATGKCYVGQSQRVKKRIAEHFRLLRAGAHTNPKLQHAFDKYGEKSFTWSVEAYCEDTADLDMIENAFISGEAFFDEPTFYNIADFAKAPMRGKCHTEASKQKMSTARRARPERYSSAEYYKRLSAGQLRRCFSDKKFVADLKYILDNPDMSYAARGRVLGIDTSSVRKKALQYAHLKGVL